MGKPKPAFQMYAADFYADTMKMTQAEVGALVRIMCQYWRDPSPMDLDELQAVAGGPVTDKAMRQLDKELQRLDALRSEYEAVSDKRSKAADARWSKNEDANAMQMHSTCNANRVQSKSIELGVIDKVESKSKEITNARVEVWPTFDDWWDAYGKKVGRDPCAAKWSKLSQDDREAIMQHTPIYVASTPEIRYRKNPLTYLNQKTWNDEQLPSNTTGRTASESDTLRAVLGIMQGR